MRVRFFVILLFFLCFIPCKGMGARLMVLYRDDVSFYKKIVESLLSSHSATVKACRLSSVDQCLNEDVSLILALGDLSYHKAISQRKNALKILALFVTDCHPSSFVKCCYLFPSLREVLLRVKKIYPKEKILVLYTPQTHWWVKKASSQEKFLFDFRDVAENLRKLFQKEFDVLILAPDPLFMHIFFLKDLVRLAAVSSKILVGLSPKMLDLGVDLVIYYDHDEFLRQIDVQSLLSGRVKVPIKVKFYGKKSKKP